MLPCKIKFKVEADFPDELRFRYLTETEKGTYTFMKSSNGTSNPPMVSVENLPLGEYVDFELCNCYYESVKELGFGFYQGKKGPQTRLELQEDKTLRYYSNGHSKQYISFDGIGILRGKAEPKAQTNKKEMPLSDKSDQKMSPLDKLCISYSTQSATNYFKFISNERGTSRNTVTILDYAPTHVVRDMVEKEYLTMIVILKENIRKENLEIRFREKGDPSASMPIPGSKVQLTKQNVIHFPIPAENTFKKSGVEFCVVNKKEAKQQQVQSEWKPLEYITMRASKRKLEKTADNFQHAEASSVNGRDGITKNLKRFLLERQQVQCLQQPPATPVNNTAVAYNCSQEAAVFTVIATSTYQQPPPPTTAFVSPNFLPPNYSTVPFTPVQSVVSNYMTPGNHGDVTYSTSNTPETINLASPDSSNSYGIAIQAQAEQEEYESNLLTEMGPIDWFINGELPDLGGDLDLPVNEEYVFDGASSEKILPQMGGYERDGGPADMMQQVTQDLSHASLNSDTDFLCFDPKHPRTNDQRSKADVAKKPKTQASQSAASHTATSKPSVTEEVARMQGLCQEEIFRIPHLIAFGKTPQEIWTEVIQKVPEVLTGEDSWGDSPLTNALLKDNNQGTKFLMHMMIDCNATAHFQDANDDGHTPLILLANSTCDEELAKTMLHFGALLTPVDNMKRSVFHYAVCNKKERMLSILLDHAFAHDQLDLLQQQDVCAMSPLHLATFYEENPKILDMLLRSWQQNKWDVNHRSYQNGNSVLHIAIIHKLLVSLDTLLKSKVVDVNLPLLDSRRPLQLAMDLQLPKEYLDLLRRCGAEDGYVHESDSDDEDNETVDSFTTSSYVTDCASGNYMSPCVKVVHSDVPVPMSQAVPTTNALVISSEQDLRRYISTMNAHGLFSLADQFYVNAQQNHQGDSARLRKVGSLRNTMLANENNVDMLHSLIVGIWKLVYSSPLK